jgi:hypothetical protein
VDIGEHARISILYFEYRLLQDMDTFHWLVHSLTEVCKIHGELSELVVPVGLGGEIERLDSFGK